MEPYRKPNQSYIDDYDREIIKELIKPVIGAYQELEETKVDKDMKRICSTSQKRSTIQKS